MEVGDTIHSAEEFEKLPDGTVVAHRGGQWTGTIYGRLVRADKNGFHPPSLVDEFGTEMSGTTETFYYPAEILSIGDGV